MKKNKINFHGLFFFTIYFVHTLYVNTGKYYYGIYTKNSKQFHDEII